MLLLGLKEEFIKILSLISVYLPSGQLKDDFKKFDSSLTKTPLSLPKYNLQVSHTEKVSSGTRKGALEKMLLIFFQQSCFCFKRGLGLEIENTRLFRGGMGWGRI